MGSAGAFSSYQKIQGSILATAWRSPALFLILQRIPGISHSERMDGPFHAA